MVFFVDGSAQQLDFATRLKPTVFRGIAGREVIFRLRGEEVLPMSCGDL
jgi:hypothetical protein